MVTLIKNSPVILKAFATKSSYAINEKIFQNDSIQVKSDSLILLAYEFYRGEPILRNFDYNIFKG